jgi:hypothetical protein
VDLEKGHCSALVSAYIASLPRCTLLILCFTLWRTPRSYINPLTLVRVMIGSPPHLKREEEKRAQDMMQSLNVWDPPEFNMMFFM